MLSIFCIFIFAFTVIYMGYLTSQTSDILFLLALDIKKDVVNSKKEILASNQYIIDILEKKQKQS